MTRLLKLRQRSLEDLDLEGPRVPLPPAFAAVNFLAHAVHGQEGDRRERAADRRGVRPKTTEKTRTPRSRGALDLRLVHYEWCFATSAASASALVLCTVPSGWLGGE